LSVLADRWQHSAAAFSSRSFTGRCSARSRHLDTTYQHPAQLTCTVLYTLDENCSEYSRSTASLTDLMTRWTDC